MLARFALLVAVVGITLFGCRQPERALPPSGSANQVHATDPHALGVTAPRSGLAAPPAPASPGATYKVNVTYYGVAALVTFSTPDGRSVSGVSERAGTDSTRVPPTEDACDCPESQLWSDTVSAGVATLRVEAREAGTLRVRIAIYGKAAEDSRSWSAGPLQLRSGEVRLLRVHLPTSVRGDSFWTEAPP